MKLLVDGRARWAAPKGWAKFRVRPLTLLSICALLLSGALYASGAFASASASVGSGVTLCAKGNNVSYAPSGICPSNATTLVVAANAEAQVLDGEVATLKGQVATLQSQVAGLKTLLAGVSRRDPDTLRFTGLNLQLVNGAGSTATTNGLGNLMIGYSDFAGQGSHNLILGTANVSSSYGGLVAGQANIVTGPYASVTGGSGNFASGFDASISGGFNNIASGDGASVSGGGNDDASGPAASVSGGTFNTASGDASSILGDHAITVSTTNGHFP